MTVIPHFFKKPQVANCMGKDDCLTHHVVNGMRQGNESFSCVNEVIFEKFDCEAGVTMQIAIHWTEAFKFHDLTTQRGASVHSVRWQGPLGSEAGRSFAKGIYKGGKLIRVNTINDDWIMHRGEDYVQRGEEDAAIEKKLGRIKL